MLNNKGKHRINKSKQKNELFLGFFFKDFLSEETLNLLNKLRGKNENEIKRK
jgi:hypothetical protein